MHANCYNVRYQGHKHLHILVHRGNPGIYFLETSRDNYSMLRSKIRVGTLPMPDSSLFNIFETRVTSLLFYFTGQVIVSIWESQERTNPWVFSFILDWTKNKNHILHSNNLCGLFGRSCGSGGLTGVGFGINSQVRLWRVKEKLEMGGVARASPLAFRLCKTGVA